LLLERLADGGTRETRCPAQLQSHSDITAASAIFRKLACALFGDDAAEVADVVNALEDAALRNAHRRGVRLCWQQDEELRSLCADDQG
jgi:hypothetical protein